METGDLEQAVAAFRNAVELSPEDSEIRMKLRRGTENHRGQRASGRAIQGRAGREVPEGKARMVSRALRSRRCIISWPWPCKATISTLRQRLTRTPSELIPRSWSPTTASARLLKRRAARTRRQSGPQANRTGQASDAVEAARDALARRRYRRRTRETASGHRIRPGFRPCPRDAGISARSPRGSRRLAPTPPQGGRIGASLSRVSLPPRPWLWYRGERDSAVAELEEALRLDPALAEACAFLGMAYREGGRGDDARRYLQRAIALNRELPAPYIDLGLVFLDAGQGTRPSDVRGCPEPPGESRSDTGS